MSPSSSHIERPWRACLDDAAATHEDVEVVASHCGLGINPLSASAVLDRLVQPVGEWRPYRSSDRAMASA